MSTASLQRLVFTGKQCVEIESFSLPDPGPGEVRVRCELSMMSTGTENICFNRLFDAGTHWDHWVKYPFYSGYISIGTVEAVGAGVEHPVVGQRVAYRVPHASHAIRPAAGFYPIPDTVSSEQAAWFALAKITFHGALAARYELGDPVLIIGAGPIGQMTLRWARVAGAAPIVVLDQFAERMAAARAGGAHVALTTPLSQAAPLLAETMDGGRPRLVMDSTGNAAVFEAALGLAADHGKVILVGDTGSPASQKLTPDVLRRGVQVIGVHDSHNTAQWNDATITRLFFRLVGDGRFPLAGLTSHIFAPEDCAEAYATANRDRAATMGILFDWSGAMKDHPARVKMAGA